MQAEDRITAADELPRSPISSASNEQIKHLGRSAQVESSSSMTTGSLPSCGFKACKVYKDRLPKTDSRWHSFEADSNIAAGKSYKLFSIFALEAARQGVGLASQA